MAYAKKQTPTSTSGFILQVSPEGVYVAPRGQKQAPPALKEIIELCNLAPVDYPFESGWWKPTADRSMDQSILASIEALPPALAEHLKEVWREPERVMQAILPAHAPLFRYWEISRWRDNLRKIARRSGTISGLTEVFFDHDRGTSYEIKDRLLVALEALEDEGDFRYIRECLHCKRIFFAGKLFYQGRIVLAACGAACRKAIHNKLSKAKNPPSELVEGVTRALNSMCRDRGWKQFRRTPGNVAELADQSGATVRQTGRVLDLLSRGSRVTRR